MKKFGFRARPGGAFMGPAQRTGLGCGCTHSRGPGGGDWSWRQRAWPLLSWTLTWAAMPGMQACR